MTVGSILKKEIVLDEEAFQKAMNEFATLGTQIQELKTEVTDMLQMVKEGFDTPAGAKFISSCETALLKPMEDQRLVITHISDTLSTARNQYESVFEEYTRLNQSINQK